MAREEISIREMCARGKMTPDRISEMSSSRQGRAKLDAYVNERMSEKKHMDRMYGTGKWDGKDARGRLFKDVVDPSDMQETTK